VSGLAESGPSIDDVVEQIRAIDLGDFLVSTVSTLASLAYGKLDGGQLEQARLGIEALDALVPVLAPEIEAETRRDLERAIADLKIAYVGAVGSTPP
jgi:hypothetical protein